MKNALIVVLALIVVGGGFFFAGQKFEENKLDTTETTATTAPDTVVENINNKTELPETTQGAVEEIPVIVTQAVIQVTEKAEPSPVIEPESEAVQPTEKVTKAESKVNKKPEEVKTTNETVKKISRDEAKKIALNHAGLKEADVRGLEIELDFEKGAYEYEVSFDSGKYDYDYEIDAVSGKIKFSEKDLDD